MSDRQEYTVTWVVELEADNPRDAARIARKWQLDPNSWATCFDITDNAGNETTIDLLEQEAE